MTPSKRTAPVESTGDTEADLPLVGGSVHYWPEDRPHDAAPSVVEITHVHNAAVLDLAWNEMTVPPTDDEPEPPLIARTASCVVRAGGPGNGSGYWLPMD